MASVRRRQRCGFYVAAVPLLLLLLLTPVLSIADGCLQLEEYAFYPGKDMQQPSLRVLANAPTPSALQLSEACDRTPGCTSFNTAGHLKSSDDMALLVDAVLPVQPCTGVYIKLTGAGKWGGLSVEGMEALLISVRDNNEEGVSYSNQLLTSVAGIQAVLQEIGYAPDAWPTLGLATLQFAADLSQLRRAGSQQTVASSSGSLGDGTGSGTSTGTGTGWGVDGMGGGLGVAALAGAAVLPASVAVLSAAAYPEWDSRDRKLTGGHDWVCPVRQQGVCASCVAFATAGAAEIAVASAQNMDCNEHLSVEWLFFCSTAPRPLIRQPKQTCDTGWVPEEAMQVISTQGLPNDECFPYDEVSTKKNCTPTDQCSPITPKAANYRQTAFISPSVLSPGGSFSQKSFKPNQLADAKAFLRENGALVTAFLYHEDLYRYYGGIYQWDGISRYITGHVVAVVGYSDTERFWIAKNSWGTEWGEGGFFKITYDDATFMRGTILGVKWIKSVDVVAEAETEEGLGSSFGAGSGGPSANITASKTQAAGGTAGSSESASGTASKTQAAGGTAGSSASAGGTASKTQAAGGTAGSSASAGGMASKTQAAGGTGGPSASAGTTVSNNKNKNNKSSNKKSTTG